MATWDLIAKIRSSLDHVDPNNSEEICTGKWEKERALEEDRMGVGGFHWWVKETWDSRDVSGDQEPWKANKTLEHVWAEVNKTTVKMDEDRPSGWTKTGERGGHGSWEATVFPWPQPLLWGQDYLTKCWCGQLCSLAPLFTPNFPVPSFSLPFPTPGTLELLSYLNLYYCESNYVFKKIERNKTKMYLLSVLLFNTVIGGSSQGN